MRYLLELQAGNGSRLILSPNAIEVICESSSRNAPTAIQVGGAVFYVQQTIDEVLAQLAELRKREASDAG